MPFRHGQGRPALTLRFRRKQVRQSLHRVQIHTPMVECPAREFPGLSAPQSGNGAQYGFDCVDDRSTAVTVKLRHVFASDSMRSRQPKKEGSVERHSARRIAQQGQARLSGGGHSMRQHLHRRPG